MDCSINIKINQLVVATNCIVPNVPDKFPEGFVDFETDKIRDLLDKQYTPKKKSNMHLATAYNIANIDNGRRKAERLSMCSRWLEFAVDDENNRHKLTKTSSCHVRLCPVCQWRRSLNTYRNMAKIYTDKSIRKHKHMFLTLTQKNVPDAQLGQELKKLSKSFTNFMKKKEISENVLGYLRSTEVTRNKQTGEYHPHIHAILTVPQSYGKKEYIRKDRFAELWAQVQKLDYNPVIDVRMIKNLTGKTLAEIAKYSVKPTDYLMDSVEDTAKIISTLDSALDGKRFVSCGGIIREKKREIMGARDIEDFEGDPISDYENWEKVIYEWHFGQQIYKRVI